MACLFCARNKYKLRSNETDNQSVLHRPKQVREVQSYLSGLFEQM